MAYPPAKLLIIKGGVQGGGCFSFSKKIPKVQSDPNGDRTFVYRQVRKMSENTGRCPVEVAAEKKKAGPWLHEDPKNMGRGCMKLVCCDRCWAF